MGSRGTYFIRYTIFFADPIEFDLSTPVGKAYLSEVHLFDTIKKKISGKLLSILIVRFECNIADLVPKGLS